MRKAAFFITALSFALIAASLPTALAAAQDTGPAAAISSPAHSAVISGDTATVTVLFDAGEDAEVIAAELYVDGELHATAPVSPPASSGSAKLTWGCGEFDEGRHTLTARVYDSLGHSRAVDVEVVLQAVTSGGDAERVRVEIIAPRGGQEISGKAQVRVAADESRVRYVMLLIDDVFVALTNMPPFTFSLNTTRYLNGLHVLRATAFDFSDNPTDSDPVNVMINNPGGRTEMRTESPAETAQPAPSPEPAVVAAEALPAETVAPPAAPASAPQSASTSAPAAPIGTPAGASTPITAAAGLEQAIGQGGTPAEATIATPSGTVQPTAAAQAVAPPRATPAAAEVIVPDASAAPTPAQPALAASAAQPSVDARSSAAAGADVAAASHGPAAATAATEAAAPLGTLPPQAVQIAMARTSPAVGVGPVAVMAAPEARAPVTSGSAIEASPGITTEATVAPSEEAPAEPAQQVAALPPQLEPAVVAAVPEPMPADAALTAAEAGVQVAALAPEMSMSADSAAMAEITTTPPPAPVHIARAPSPPIVVSATRSERGDVILHTVRPGEQLGTISARYSVPTEAIARLNGLHANAELAAGRTLRIPWQSSLVLNGESVYTDVPVLTEGGISLAPFRAIVEHAGGAVHWIPASRQVRAKAFARDIWVTIGSRAA
ncbi:MAG: LysM peptidoglycan-binding domain-containing protein, partial [Armatimonadota bacterium]